MKATSLKRLIVAGTLALVWSGLNSFCVQAQSRRESDADMSARLPSGAKCVSSATDSSYQRFYGEDVKNVSVGRQLYTSAFSMRMRGGEFVMLTCDVDIKRFSTLNLKFGISDGEADINPIFTVNIYQAGNKVATYKNLTRGRLIPHSVNLQQSGNIALEVILERSNHGHPAVMYFFDAQLIPNPSRISNPSSSELEVVPTASQTDQPSVVEAQQVTVPSQPVQKPSSNTSNNGSFLNGISGFINDVNSIRQSIDLLLGR